MYDIVCINVCVYLFVYVYVFVYECEHLYSAFQLSSKALYFWISEL